MSNLKHDFVAQRLMSFIILNNYLYVLLRSGKYVIAAR